MGLMNFQQMQPFAQPESRALRSGVTAAMHYPMHSGPQARSVDGAPDLTVNGTVGTLWSANWASATPDGATNYLTAAVGNAALEEIFDLTDLTGQELLFGFDWQSDGALATNEALYSWGSNQVGAGLGGYHLYIASSSQIGMSFRGIGSSGGESTALLSGTAMATSDRYSVVISLVGTAAGVATLAAYRYRHGTGPQDGSQQSGVNILGTGGASAPGVNSAYALTLLARRDTSAYNRVVGATAGSNAKVGNVWAARCSSVVVGLADQCLADMVSARGELPQSLRA